MMLPIHDSLRPSEPPLSISREQAAKIIHHHFTEHRNSDVQLQHIPGAYHRYADWLDIIINAQLNVAVMRHLWCT